MNLDEMLHKQLMQALLGRGGNPRDVFRARVQIKRNEIFWKLINETKV
jgi:hypothetical protein